MGANSHMHTSKKVAAVLDEDVCNCPTSSSQRVQIQPRFTRLKQFDIIVTAQVA